MTRAWMDTAIGWSALAVLAGAAACQSPAPRYAVTATPVDAGGGLPPICVAVDAKDPQGVSWWLPGRTGCASRGSGIMAAHQATVSAQASAVTAAFDIETHGGNTVAVRLAVEGGEIRVVASGARTPIERRHDLNLPEVPPYGRRGGG